MGVLPVSLKIGGYTYRSQDVEIYFRSVPKVVDEKRTKKPRKLPVIRGSTRRQGPRTWLKYDEQKGMVCEWRVEDKQTLVTENVLNSNRFIGGCNSYKADSIS